MSISAVTTSTSASQFRAALFEELMHRRNKNPLYSLRAFARDLQVSTTCLSDVLAQKRNFSKKNALKVARSLGMSVDSVESAAPTPAPAREGYQLRQLSEEEFEQISDWYHYAILNLAKLRTNNANPDWIARRLGIETEQAKTSLDRLMAAGLIQVSSGRLHRTSLPLTAGNGGPSPAQRKFHKQFLALAEGSLERDPIESREFVAATLAIDPSRIEEAKTMMFEALKNIAAFLELGDAGHRKEVYALGLQFFPLTRGSENENE